MSRRRASRNTRQQPLILTAALVIVVAVILIAASGGFGNAAPPVEQARLELDPVLGDPNAPVTLIEYGAYACPACRQWHQARIVEQILELYPGRVKFVFRDYPVISPAYDRLAAELSQCVLDQGQELYWAFHDALYTRIQPPASQDELIRAAGELGVNTDALRTCASASTHRATVDFDLQRGRNLGLPGTPSFLVNDQRIFNASPQALVAAIEQALAGY